MERRKNRSLRNPYSKKSKTSLRFLSTLIIVFLFCISTVYFVVATNFFMNQDQGTNGTTGSTNNASTNTVKNDISSSTGNVNDFNTQNTIAYAISLTSCEQTPSLIDGAAVLAHSIHLSSSQNPASKSKYNYKMYAIVHESAKACQPLLEKLNYTVKIVTVPVEVDDIQGDFLREGVHSNGCCGELEFIKLWAYTLTDHPFVVHMDLDTTVLKPMDELFDAALNGDTTNVPAIMWEKEHHRKGDGKVQIDAFFTRDYNMRMGGKPDKPVGVQGGFLVMRPSMQVFNEFKDIIRKGDYTRGRGWGGLGFGPFYGAMTFQGIIPYFYDALHPGTGVELNRCLYNQMADNPRDKRTVNDVVSGKCRDGRGDCEDCRERKIDEIFTAHFTLCQKPWHCLDHQQDMLQHRLCRKLFGEWFRIRADLEKTPGVGTHDPNHYHGFCKAPGAKGYIPLKL